MIGQLIGKYPIAQSTQLSTSISGSFYFNDFNLSDCGTIGLNSSNHDDIDASIDTYQVPQGDGGGVLSRFVPNKPIAMTIAVKEETEAALNSKIDLMKRKLAKREGTLKIKVNGNIRQCKASLVSLKFNRDYQIKDALAEVVISFLSMENLVSESPTAVSEIGTSASVVPFDITNDGGRCNYKMYIVFGAVAGTDFVTVMHKGYSLDISATITTGSILTIDGMIGKVSLNGVDIDSNGPIRMLDEGSNSISVGINGTYTADITILYNTNYR